jgi:hypothetical protein
MMQRRRAHRALVLGRRWRWAAAVLTTTVAVVGLLGRPVPAGAHSGNQSYVYIDLLADRMEGRVEYLARDLELALRLGIDDDEDAAPAQLDANRATLEAFTGRHVGLDLGAGEVPLRFGELEYLELSQGSYVVHHFSTGPLGTEPPRTFDVRFDAFLTDMPDRTVLLLIGRDWRTGVIANEAEHLRVFDRSNTSHTVALDEGSWLAGMRGTISLGVEHIRTGADHVMFILTLLLPSVLLFRNGWQPAPGFRSSLLRVIKVATAFTAAHSITLSLAALGLLNLDTKLVETVIAVSIILAALHNLRPVFVNREWVLAFAFGLFHGLGFAGLLDELGLGRDQRLWTLLGFNLGVEVGQVAIIVLIFPTLFLLRRTRFYPAVLVGGSLLLAAVATGWAIERLLELEPRVDSLFDPILYFPRVLFLLGGAMAVAAGVRELERRKHRLRELPVDTAEDVEPPTAVHALSSADH